MRIAWPDLAAALGLLLVIEGILPFLNPGAVRRTLQQISATDDGVLRAAGASLDDVVDVTTFHTDPSTQIETVMKVREAVLGGAPYPNWTAVGVNWLAGFDFEIKAIARIPARS